MNTIRTSISDTLTSAHDSHLCFLRPLSGCVDNIARTFTSKTATMTIVISHGVPDPNAPPPYELKQLPERGIGGAGPAQYTLHYTPIPEHCRARPCRANIPKCNNRTSWQSIVKRAFRKQRKFELFKTHRDKEYLEKTTRASTGSASVRNGLGITIGAQLLSVPSFSKAGAKREVQEEIDDREWLDMAMSVLLPDFPQKRWPEGQGLGMVMSFLGVESGGAKTHEQVRTAGVGVANRLNINGHHQLEDVNLSPIIEENDDPSGVIHQQ